MIAYNKEWLYNSYVMQQAVEAVHSGCIGRERYEQLKADKPVKFYSPNIYATIALGLLTVVIVAFATGLLALIFQPEKGAAIFCVFLGGLCWGAAELAIAQNAHYNSGVDNILVWAAAVFFIFAAAIGFGFFDYNPGRQWHPEGMVCLLSALVCAFLSVRFVDAILSIAAVLALMLSAYFMVGATTTTGSAILPFALMAVSALVFIFANKYTASLVLYRTCLRYVKITALLLFYAAGNYFMLQRFNTLVFMKFGAAAVAFGWIWTFAIPVVYLFWGIKKKDILFLRTSLIVLATAVVTFKLYHHVLSQEAALLLAGIVLIAASYSLIRFLHVPKGGFTFAPDAIVTDRPELDKVLTGHLIEHASGGTPSGKGDGWG